MALHYNYKECDLDGVSDHVITEMIYVTMVIEIGHFTEKNIKEVLLNFENIKEKEILSLLKLDNENGNFALLKRKLLFDFYYKNGQLKKANQIKNIIK